MKSDTIKVEKDFLMKITNQVDKLTKKVAEMEKPTSTICLK